MKDIVVYHYTLMDKHTGSSEKLLRDLALILADCNEFIIHLVYSVFNEVEIVDKIKNHKNIRLVPFNYSKVELCSPCRLIGMEPTMDYIIDNIKPKCFIGLVWSNNQEMIRKLPETIPVMLISPFGNVCSNGNLRKLYVSGLTQTDTVKRQGINHVEQFFNPLVIPPFNFRKNRPANPGDPVVFGRSGRSDAAIFDPISFIAFARLEGEYGNKVRFIYINPSDSARELATKLNIKRIEFRSWLSNEELASFYQEIDVFAHARKDGETIGISIAEAMLAQNAVVSHRSMMFNDHVHLLKEPFGKVVDIGDADGYYACMKYFVENNHRLHEFGRLAREYSQPIFDIDVIGNNFISDVNEVCSYYGIPGQKIPYNSNAIEIIRDILLRASQGSLTIPALIDITDICTSAGNHQMSTLIYKTWIENSEHSFTNIDFKKFSPGMALLNAGRECDAAVSWRTILTDLTVPPPF